MNRSESESQESELRTSVLLTRVWFLLIALTLFSAFVAERVAPTALIVMLICATLSLKGVMVIERLMGLNKASKEIRWMMLSYFCVLPVLIALVVIFPDVLLRLTTL